MATGTIKSVSERGFAFVSPDAGGKDLFMHVSQFKSRIEFDGRLVQMPVEFEIGQDRNLRPCAINVRPTG